MKKMMMTTMMTNINPIQGLGNDIIEVERIEKSIERYGSHFLQKIFTPSEIAYCVKHNKQSRHFAGRFAAKEAIAKALGCGFGHKLSWHDVEILNHATGKPYVILSQKASTLFNAPVIHLSISHCKKYASAVAIWT
jgi:holo-[acyl-carrier protein] synthase